MIPFLMESLLVYLATLGVLAYIVLFFVLGVVVLDYYPKTALALMLVWGYGWVVFIVYVVGVVA